MMAAGKKKPNEKNRESLGNERTLQDDAEKHLAHTPKHSPELKGKTSEQLIYELQVHQIELETQAEELRRAYLALEESRDKFLDLYEFAPLGYVTLNDKALITEANLACATLLGIARNKLIMAQFGKFIVQKDSDQWFLYFRNALNRDGKQICTLMLIREDGSVFPARLEGLRLTGSDGVTKFRIAISDISDIWQIEALKSQYSILNGILESTDAAVFSLDRKYRYTSFNSHHAMVMKKLYGADIEPYHSIFDYQPVEEDQAQAKHNIDRVLAGEYVIEEAFSGEEGRSRRYFEVTHYPIKDTGKKVVGVAVFAQDITERKRAEEKLKFSNVILSTQQEVSIDGILVVDESGKIISFNQRFIEIWGIPQDVIASMSDERALQSVIDKMADPEEFLARVNYLYTNRDEKSREEIALKDGRVLDRYSAPMSGCDGKYYGRIWNFRDITERKVAEEVLRKFSEDLERQVTKRTSEISDINLKLITEIDIRLDAEKQINKTLGEKEVLLREVHHRVKNNLQIIISLLSLQSRYMKDETTLAAFRESKNRIQAMALVHEKLYRSTDLTKLDLGDYLKFLGNNLLQFFGVKGKGITLTMDIHDIFLAIDTAIPLGLIINELISNSLKHAFPDGRNGKISLAVHRHDHTLTILFKDTGIGIPSDFDWRNAESLGLRLVCSLVDQLDGTIELDRISGTAFTIVVKEKV